jgi:hypothetical protein
VADRRSFAPRVPRSKRTQALDEWLRSLERIEDARVELRDALDALEPSILDAVDAIAGGEPMAELVSRTRLRTRRQMTDALSAMTSALARTEWRRSVSSSTTRTFR